MPPSKARRARAIMRALARVSRSRLPPHARLACASPSDRLHDPAVLVEPVHDRGLVRASEDPERPAVVDRGALLFMGAPLKLDYLWAALCLMGAVYFVFRA